MSSDQTFDQAAWQAYKTAIRLLGPRDHSIFELNRKLQQRDHAPQAIQSAISELQADNYLNDQRYAITFVEQRVARGYGPLWINAKLRERGVDEELIELAVEQQSVNWTELAKELVQKRYDVADISSKDARTEFRIARFLSSRGFSGRDSLRALQAARQESTIHLQNKI